MQTQLEQVSLKDSYTIGLPGAVFLCTVRQCTVWFAEAEQSTQHGLDSAAWLYVDVASHDQRPHNA